MSIDGEQKSARHVERGAGTLSQPCIGEMDPDPRQHFFDHDRLGDVVNAAGFQPMYDVLGLSETGHEDDRYIAQARPPA